MSLDDYFRQHLLTIVEIIDREAVWKICCSNSGARPLPNGDTSYAGDGIKPFWQKANPFFLIPLSSEAHAAADKAYLEQNSVSPDGDDPASWLSATVAQAFPSDLGVSRAVQLCFSSHATPSADPKTEAVVTLGANMAELRNGRWFKLAWPNEKICVWISTDAIRNEGLITWDLLPSHIGGPTPICELRGELGLIARGITKQDTPYVLAWHQKHPDVNHLAGQAQVIWWGSANGFDRLEFNTEEIALGPNHQIEWKKQDDQNYTAVYTRSFVITADHPRPNSLADVLYPRTNGQRTDIQVHIEQLCDVTKTDSRHIIRLLLNTDSANLLSIFLSVWNDRIVGPLAPALFNIKRGAGVSVAPGIDSHWPSPPPALGWLQTYEIKNDAGNWGFVILKSGVTDGIHDDFFDKYQCCDAVLYWSAVNQVAPDSGSRSVLSGKSVLSTRYGLAAKTYEETQPDDGTLFEFFLQQQLSSTATIHDGALEFDSGGKVDPSLNIPHYGRLRALLHLRNEQQPLFLFQWTDDLASTAVELSYSVEELIFPLLTIRAAGEDPRPEDEYVASASTGAVVQGSGERPDPPLVFTLPQAETADATSDSSTKDNLESREANDAQAANYLLIANESTNVAQSLRLDFRIDVLPSAESDAENNFRVVVLDSAPQLIALVSTQFARHSKRDIGTATIARRSPLSEEQNGWEVFDENALTDGFELRLPSQDLGEQAIKGKDDFPEDATAQSRFGPPAVLRIAPERLDRGFVAVPWNLRRILINRETASPGVPLLEAYFELLYGLAAHLKHPDLLVTEIGGKLGELPTPALAKPEWQMTNEQINAFSLSWRQFLQAYRGWGTRVALLELSHVSEPLQPLKLTEGIEYRARVDVDVPKDPQNKTTTWKKGASFAWPNPRGFQLGANGTQSQPSESVITDPPDELKAFHRVVDGKAVGLKGGAFWGFESLEIYKEFWQYYKQSSSGAIADLAFSSIGGYGKQTARFAHDKTSIVSTTTGGRTHVYAVERIGRIGVLWNKAKHVILYERTTAPSDQMANQQNPHLGRPLLRKVKEYVEILEPERGYPDFTGHDLSAAGAVRVSAFRTRIFPVLSTWGRTVYLKSFDQGTKTAKTEPIGWEVPLWREGANLEIYPKPQVLLHLTPPRDSDVDFVPVTFEQPEVLRFYTDTRDKDPAGNVLTADVHLWPVVEGVDYTNQPDPTIADVSPTASTAIDGFETPLPGAVFVPPGFERFTFRVLPSEFPADVATQYFANARVSGKLRTVTMMRSQPAADTGTWWPSKPSSDSENARDALGALIGSPTQRESVLSRAQNGFTEITAPLKNNPGKPGVLKLQTFRDKATIWFDQAKETLGKLHGQVDREPSPQNRFRVPPGQTENQGLWTNLTSKPGGDIWKLQTRPGKAVWQEILEGSDGVVSRVLGFYDDVTGPFLGEIDSILAAPTNLANNAVVSLTKLIDRLNEFNTQLGWDFGPVLDLAQLQLSRFPDATAKQIETLIATPLVDELTHLDTDLAKAKTQLLNLIDSGYTQAKSKIIEPLKTNVLPIWGNDQDLVAKVQRLELAVTQLHDTLRHDILAITTSIDDLISATKQSLDQNLAVLEDAARAACQKVVQVVQPGIDKARNILSKPASDLQAWITAGIKQLVDIRGQIKAAAAVAPQLLQKMKQTTADVRKSLTNALVGISVKAPQAGIAELLVGSQWQAGKTPADDTIYNAVLILDQAFREAAKYLESLLPDIADGDISTALNRLFDALDSAAALENAIKTGNVDAIIANAEKLANDVNTELGKMAGEVAELGRDAIALANTGDAVVQGATNVLRNVRSVWDEFTAPGLGFNRRTIEMVVKFNPKNIEERLGLTPCMARVKQLGDQLEGLGLRFPAVGLADRLLPAVNQRFGDLKQSLLDRFDFSNLMSDIGGMRLTKLLPGLKMPQWAENKIKITHGFDKEKLKAWVKAESDIQFTDRKTLMHFGPLLVALDKGHFTGTVQIEADVEGRTSKVARGALIGDWTIEVGGTAFITYENVGIHFEGGKLHFDLDPKRMKSPGLLKLLTDATEMVPGQDNGFKVGVVTDGGFPTGVRADLELGPFGASGGVSGISNLLFGGFFELLVFEPPNKFAFSVSTGFHVGRQESPFDLQIFILGGGGYLDASFLYKPEQDQLAVDVALAVHASASLRINVGWMQGGVAIYLGLEAEYHKKPADHPAFYCSLFVMVEGYVSILGLITVQLMLRLNCTFKSLENGGTEFVGSGTVSVTIKISCFFKITVHKTYTRVIARKDGHAAQVTAARFNQAFARAVARAEGNGEVDAITKQLQVARDFHQLIAANVGDPLSTFRQNCDAHIEMLAPT